jgi:hypothetical protein
MYDSTICTRAWDIIEIASNEIEKTDNEIMTTCLHPKGEGKKKRESARRRGTENITL